MRIISKFRDYYDGVQIYGADPDLKYVRTREILDPKKDGKDLAAFHIGNVCLYHDWRFFGIYYFVPIYVYFCGKAYPLIEIGTNDHIQYCRDIHTLLDFMKRNDLPIPRNLDPKVPWFKFLGRSVADFLERPPIKIPELFISHKCPIMVTRSNPRYLLPLEIFKNPRLLDYDFQKILDPNTAFQELSMFLGGILTNAGNPMVAVDEKKRIEKRGFDKWSFRKPPTKKKLK